VTATIVVLAIVGVVAVFHRPLAAFLSPPTATHDMDK
jgi:hypothetical protein